MSLPNSARNNQVETGKQEITLNIKGHLRCPFSFYFIIREGKQVNLPYDFDFKQR
jgi:hypothetical protein